MGSKVMGETKWARLSGRDLVGETKWVRLRERKFVFKIFLADRKKIKPGFNS